MSALDKMTNPYDVAAERARIRIIEEPTHADRVRYAELMLVCRAPRAKSRAFVARVLGLRERRPGDPLAPHVTEHWAREITRFTPANLRLGLPLWAPIVVLGNQRAFYRASNRSWWNIAYGTPFLCKARTEPGVLVEGSEYEKEAKQVEHIIAGAL